MSTASLIFLKTRVTVAWIAGMFATTQSVTATNAGNSLLPSSIDTADRFALMRSIARPLVASIVPNAASVAPADVPISVSALLNALPSLAIRPSTPCPASMLPNMSMTGTPESAMISITSSRSPPEASTSLNETPAISSNAVEAFDPVFPSSARAAFIWLAATDVGVPEAVSTAIEAPTSSRPTPSAAAIGPILENEAWSSGTVVLPSRTVVKNMSLASAASRPVAA